MVKRRGRPQKEIALEEFEKLCGLFCTEEDIADFFECSTDTVNRWCKRTYGESFAEVYSKKRAKGKTSLRRAQLALAETNAAMAIFLGKNYLGQADRQETGGIETGGITINVCAASLEDMEGDEVE